MKTKHTVALVALLLFAGALLWAQNFAPDGSTPTGIGVTRMGGIFNSVLPSYSNGQLATLQVDSSGRLQVAPAAVDPCASSEIAKSSAAISIASATTVQLVAPSGSTVVYVCGASFTIAPSATSADTVQFNTGTGATCSGSNVVKTGTFGNGDLTSAAPVVPVMIDSDGTAFSSAAGSGLCATTTGTAVSVQGVLSFVQQ